MPPVEPPVTPPPAGGPPLAGPVGEPANFAANIRLSKYPEDIRQPIQDWAAAHPEEVQAARRGVRSDAQVLTDAQTLVEDMGGNFAKLQKRWQPGEAWNAEEVTAIRGTLRAKTEAVLEAATVARAENSAANHANLLLALGEQARVQELVHGVTAEAGRSLRAFRQEAFDAVKVNDTRRLEELLRRIGGRDKLDEIAGALGKLDLTNPVAVNNFIRSVQKPGFWDYVMELFINSILSGPKTHIINELSNIALMVGSPVERFTAAGIERGLAPLQGRKVARFFAEVPTDAFGAIEGIPEGIAGGLSTLKNGITPTQASKWEFRRTAFKGKLGRVIRAPGTALEAADTMNYAMNYRAALNANILREAKVQGLRGTALVERVAELKAAPTEALMKEAARIAEYRLFRQPPGAITTQLLGLREKVPPLKFVIPFLNTPINLFKYGLERSPVGMFNPSLWRNLAAKNPAASDQLARVFLGSTLAAAIAWKFQEGRITGAVPTNRAERDRFYREGKQPFSMRIGDRWVQYQRLEPLNQPIGQVAAALLAIEQKDTDARDKIGTAVITLAENLVSQTYLSGLADFLNATAHIERSGEAFLMRTASGMVPASSLLRTVTQQVDPTIRKGTTPVERLEAGIPGLSQNVPPRLTAFGQEAERQTTSWFPIGISKAQQSQVDAELERVGMEVGFVGATIQKKELTQEQQQRYQVLAGQQTYKNLQVLFTSAGYRAVAVSDENRRKTITAAITRARNTARAALAKEFTSGGGGAGPKTPPQALPKSSPQSEYERILEELRRTTEIWNQRQGITPKAPVGVR